MVYPHFVIFDFIFEFFGISGFFQVLFYFVASESKIQWFSGGSLNSMNFDSNTCARSPELATQYFLLIFVLKQAHRQLWCTYISRFSISYSILSEFQVFSRKFWNLLDFKAPEAPWTANPPQIGFWRLKSSKIHENTLTSTWDYSSTTGS